MLRKVLTILSQIFFSICITSRLCCNNRNFQYSNSKKIDFFFQHLFFFSLFSDDDLQLIFTFPLSSTLIFFSLLSFSFSFFSWDLVLEFSSFHVIIVVIYNLLSTLIIQFPNSFKYLFTTRDGKNP